MKKHEVTALGELLIDFTMNGVSDQGNPVYEANPGGAPCNVLAMLTKLGHQTAFIGKVGQDMFGKQLEQTLKKTGIDSYLVREEKVPTTLAFVKKLPGGDRDFCFYRNPGADVMLKQEEIPLPVIENSRIFHFGSLSMTHDGVYEATKKAVLYAEEKKVLISFDPNLRRSLWESDELARKRIDFGLSHCQILKIADDEVTFVTGNRDCVQGASELKKRYRIPLVLLTRGREGSCALYEDICVCEEAFLQKETTDTTGAGDTFFGAALHMICQEGVQGLTKEKLSEMLRFANAASSLITLKKGALCVMPDREQIEKLVRERQGF
ncbi:MAG: carbohydrate kinase [Lachnospiraceae bacterium]|nr:carbohydrate kinase [Lachnospiraceae bacterium]